MQAFDYQGQTFFWRDHRWMDHNYLAVETRLARELDQTFPRPSMGPRQLAQKRVEAKHGGQRSLLYAVGQPDPENPASVAVFSGIYRDMGQPLRALEITDGWKHSTNPFVLVARSAALCDLERWVEAERLAKRALLHGGGFPASSVLNRIYRDQGII